MPPDGIVGIPGPQTREDVNGRNPDRLKQAAAELGAQRTAAFDANDAASLARFFQDLPAPIDHVMVTAGGPRYGPLLEMDAGQVRQALSDHVVRGLKVARNAVGKMRPGGTLLLMGGTGARRVGHGLGIPIGRVVGPADVAALAVHIMSNTALTGATYDIDGGQQFVS